MLIYLISFHPHTPHTTITTPHGHDNSSLATVKKGDSLLIYLTLREDPAY